jgi:hypothetical protein
MTSKFHRIERHCICLYCPGKTTEYVSVGRLELENELVEVRIEDLRGQRGRAERMTLRFPASSFFVHQSPT